MYQANEHSGPVVYSTNQPRTPLPARQSLSIKVIAYGSATIIFALFLAITATDLMLARDHYRNDNSRVPQQLTNTARAIEAQLTVFSQIAQHVASQPATKDILKNLNDKAGAKTWARQMHQFLPQATGIALLTPDGKILGRTSGQSLTPQCLTDMSKIIQKEAMRTPVVHQELSGDRHFDLTSPVADDAGNTLGMLFVSIDVNNLDPLLHTTNNKTRLTLLDGYDNTIVQKGTIRDISSTRQTEVSLAGTHWKLRLLEPASGSLGSYLSLAIFNISAILLTVGVIAFLVRFIMGSMNSDFDQVKTALGSLANGEHIGDALPTPRLRETAEVFPSMVQINRIMEKKQQLLEHHELIDKLTGLSNRRQFNIEFARAYDFARRGTPVCVVRIHLAGLDKLTKNQANQVVKIMACTLNEHSRRIDHAARLDTDQLALLMFGASPEGTTPCLERIFRSFHRYLGEHPAIPNDHGCTLKIAYTRIHAHRDGNAAQVLKRVEEALGKVEQSSDHHIISA